MAQIKWEYDGIVNEELDTFGVKHYEVKWRAWHREDGTNTTWQQNMSDMLDVKDRWDERQADKRAAEAKKSLSIKVAPEPGQLWHEDATVEAVRGFEEKRREALRVGLQHYMDWDNVSRLRDSDSEDDDLGPQEGDSERESPPPLPPSRPGTRARLSSRPAVLAAQNQINNRPSPSVSAPSRQSQPRFKSSSLRHRQSTVSASPTPSDGSVAPRPVRPLPRRHPIIRSASPETHDEEILGRRKTLQEQWTRAARRTGAAAVYIFNEVNAEDVPPGLDDFEYCEQHYTRAKGITRPVSAANYLVTCECDTFCDDAQICGCQELSDLVVDDRREFAYTDDKLFKFNLPPGVEVIECNKNCSCHARSCPNRVAQQPRDVPIEIFRTEERGWGVRATIDLARGKVLGIYTGQVITRREAAQRTGLRKSYIFDLDVREVGSDDEDEHGKYSVDSYKCGNWTRFTNHSCEPNMRVFPVIWDIVPELNQPYLAFVTNQAVPARTELTIDYSPKAALAYKQNKGKGKAKIPPGAKPCMCGTESCRGWIQV